MAAMKENTKKVITYLQGLDATDNVTAADVAEALGLEKRSVDGIFTSAIQRKKLRLSWLMALIRRSSSSVSPTLARRSM